MLFAKFLVVLSALVACEAINLITPENQHQFQGIIASLITPEQKKMLLQAAFGNSKNNPLRANKASKEIEEIEYSVSGSK